LCCIFKAAVDGDLASGWGLQFYGLGKDQIMDEILKSVEAPENPNIPELRAGDTVKVYLRIKEGANERTQEFRGTVIRLRGGGNNGNFTVRRLATNGVGVERTFLLRSPRLEKVVVERHAQVRRAQLYFLRDRTGKSARLKQKFN
jgi:large subunit ribosomal protein L19